MRRPFARGAQKWAAAGCWVAGSCIAIAVEISGWECNRTVHGQFAPGSCCNLCLFGRRWWSRGGSSTISAADCVREWFGSFGLDPPRHMAVPLTVLRCQGPSTSSEQTSRSQDRRGIKIMILHTMAPSSDRPCARRWATHASSYTIRLANTHPPAHLRRRARIPHLPRFDEPV